MKSKTQRNIFLILSPFQLICAQEAREKFCQNEKNFLILIDRRGPETVEYAQKASELDDGWSKVTRLSEPPLKGFKRFLTRLRNTLYIFYTQGFGRGKVFMGDPYINWFRYLSNIYANERIWLDDGAASIIAIDRFFEKGLLDKPNKTTPKFFSVFAFPDLVRKSNGALERNTLDLVRSRRRKSQSISKNRAFFLGQWLSERSGVNEDDELSVLFQGLSDLPDWDVTYIAHRLESAEKLQRISERCTVVRLEQSIESELLQSETLPEMIISWYSTTLFTLPLLFEELKVISFQVPLSAATEKQRTSWMNVYDALRNQGVEIRQY